MGKRDEYLRLHLSGKPSGLLAKGIKVIGATIVIIVAIAVFNAAIEHFVPSERTVRVDYPHGIVAIISYDAFQGYPLVDSTFTFAQIISDTCITKVVFDLNRADYDARPYLAFTVFQLPPEQGDRWIRAYEASSYVTLPTGSI